MEGYYLGMDIGSVSANTVILSESNQVLKEDYQRTKGQPLETALSVLQKFFQEFPAENCRSLTLTGAAGKLVAEILKVPLVNEIIAQARAVDFFHPQVRTIIEMGGEDSKLILLAEEASGNLAIQDFAMNTLCAAGTGSFLDQQAHRLGLTIEEFSALALKSAVPPRIAGRCTVFAKTDMIHLQQEATPDYDIIAGLCFAVARNLKSNIAKGKKFIKPVAFQGGVAANLGVRRAFTEVLGLGEGELVIPEHFFSMGAIGASLVTREDPQVQFPVLRLGPPGGIYPDLFPGSRAPKSADPEAGLPTTLFHPSLPGTLGRRKNRSLPGNRCGVHQHQRGGHRPGDAGPVQTIFNDRRHGPWRPYGRDWPRPGPKWAIGWSSAGPGLRVPEDT